MLDEFGPLAHRIGIRLAELHAAFAAADDRDPGFKPVPVDEAISRTWRDGVLHGFLRGTAIIAEAAAATNECSKEERRIFRLLTERQGEGQRLVTELSGHLVGCLATRIHGGFHLGQVLVLPDDACMIEFTGEPGIDSSENGTRLCPLKDVAGLLSSLDYVGEAVARAGSTRGEHDHARVRRFLEQIRERSCGAFIRGYREVLVASVRPWVPPDVLLPLIRLFLIDRAASAICSEAIHRPSWLRVPVCGLLRVVEGSGLRMLPSDPSPS